MCFPHLIEHTLDNLFFLILCYYLLFHKFTAVEFIDCRMFFDFFVEQRIGRRWLIHFIMTVAAIADEIDDDLLIEVLSVFQYNLNESEYIFRLVGVHMENGEIKSESCNRRIDCRSRVSLLSGEADTVIGDNMK